MPAGCRPARSRWTLEEEFAAHFDEPHREPMDNTWPTSQCSRHSSRTPPATAFGFGSASLRFRNKIHPTHIIYGTTNGAIVQLERTHPVIVPQMPESAPSRSLPLYASRFELLPGRSFGITGCRDEVVAGSTDTRQFMVQAKHIESPMERTEAPNMFAIAAPRGAGAPNALHEQPAQLLTPAEQRGAIVFHKCHERARRNLRKEAHDACRLALLMRRNYPNGCMGVESAGTPDSHVYASQRERMAADDAAATRHRRGRCERLRTKAATRLPYPILSHDSQNEVVAKIAPRKSRALGRDSGHLSEHHYLMRPAVFEGSILPDRNRQQRPFCSADAQCKSAQAFPTLVEAPRRGYNIISGVSEPPMLGRG